MITDINDRRAFLANMNMVYGVDGTISMLESYRRRKKCLKIIQEDLLYLKEIKTSVQEHLTKLVRDHGKEHVLKELEIMRASGIMQKDDIESDIAFVKMM